MNTAQLLRRARQGRRDRPHRRHGRRRRPAGRRGAWRRGRVATPSRTSAWPCGRPSAATTSPPLRLILLGDALALGVGVDVVEETVGGQLATMLADAGARVALSTVAVSGARCADLATQVARAQLGPRPDLAVILVGTNDATHLVRPGRGGGRARHRRTPAARRRHGGRRRHLPGPRRGPGDRAPAAPDRRLVRPAGGPRPGQCRPRGRSRGGRPRRTGRDRCSGPTPACSATTASTPPPTVTGSSRTRCSRSSPRPPTSSSIKD